MRWLGAILGGSAFVVGCVSFPAPPELVPCSNPGVEADSVFCPQELTCTNVDLTGFDLTKPDTLPTLCGVPPTEDVCFGIADDLECNTDLTMPPITHGYCRSGVCTPCNPNLNVCRYQEWTSMNSGTEVEPRDIWVARPDEIYVVGVGRTVLRYNGIAWERIEIAAGGDVFESVWAASSTDIFVTTSVNTVWHNDGAVWTPNTPAGNPSSLTDIHGLSNDNVVIVGFNRVIQYQGTWGGNDITPSGPAVSYSGVWMRGTDIFVLGTDGMARHRSDANVDCGISDDADAQWDLGRRK